MEKKCKINTDLFRGLKNNHKMGKFTRKLPFKNKLGKMAQ